jgi:hypothetical protein
LNASISNPFIAKLWTVLREDYGKAELRGDLAAGLTVAVAGSTAFARRTSGSGRISPQQPNLPAGDSTPYPPSLGSHAAKQKNRLLNVLAVP